MTFPQLLPTLTADTLASTAAFRPELTLCGAIVLILLLRVFRLTARFDSFYVALLGSAIALFLCAPFQSLNSDSFGVDTIARAPLFTGLLAYDAFTVYLRVVLMSFAVIFCIFTRITGVPDREAAPDIYVLLLGATVGMCLMASANHLLIVFLGVEMASVPSYALAGMLKGRRQSSEAALKYAVYGAGAAGVMLYGLSLLAGLLGSVHLPTMAVRLAALMQQSQDGASGGPMMVLALGALMITAGLAFKLSATPFHFWCPDVFEGATAEVNAFLSVASKAAALALLVRVVVGFSYVNSDNLAAADLTPRVNAVSNHAPTESGLIRAVSLRRDEANERLGPPTEFPADHRLRVGSSVSETAVNGAVPVNEAPVNVALSPVRDFLAKLTAFIAVITCTFGNLAAYGQTNIKRLLAYSTIAHAGYMIMPVAAALTLAGSRPDLAEAAIGALTLYIGLYLFMNVGAFAVVAVLRNELRSEEIHDYAGLIRRAPFIVVCFAIMLVSLIGLPPLSGFVGKFAIFAALVQAKMYTVLVIAGLNTAISLFYYLRVVKVMTMEPEPAARLPVHFSFIPTTFIGALAVPTLFFGIWWHELNRWMVSAASGLFS